MFDPHHGSLWVVSALLSLLFARWLLNLILHQLNERATRVRARELPSLFREVMDSSTYDRSVRYTLAKSQFNQIESTFGACLLSAILLAGVLPQTFRWGTDALGASAASVALLLWIVAASLSLAYLPFDWVAQFRLEEQFGFNTTSRRTWCLDRLKGLGLSLLLGYPVFWLLLSLPAWCGTLWWLWAWTFLVACQLFLTFIAPILILPLFNRFTPLPEGELRQRLDQLAQRTQFEHRGIFVMDGSRRSRHSNAFFTGLGRFRRIVLYDTLLSQLDAPELEAVLAHEIGHFRLGHIPKTFAAAAGALLVLLFVVGQIAASPWPVALGFEGGGLGPLLLLAIVYGGAFSFWITPLTNAWSRRIEYQADQFAGRCMGSAQPLITALRKLTYRNLGNLTPHPAYSWFYYSHPTLWERERALDQLPTKWSVS